MTAVADTPRVREQPVQRPAPDGRVTLRAVVARGLRDRRRSILSWGLPVGAMSGFIVAIYPSIQDTLDQLAKNYPDSLKQAFGA